MKVILFKLDNPGNEYEWWIKDVEIKTSKDIEQIMGFCSNHLYAEIYQVDENDVPALVDIVKSCLSAMITHSAKDTIMKLFEMVKLTCN